MSTLNLIRNAIQTPDGTILESTSRHDCVVHEDNKTKRPYMVDGGLSYIRRSNHGDEIPMALYDNEPHDIQRVVLTWGTYGKHGDEPYRRVTIAEMSLGHLVAVLETQNPSPVHKACMEKEVRLRYD